MRRIAEQVVSVLRAFAPASLVLGALSVPAAAGDRALLDPVGFSGDGRWFAFEEFGVQDGSGFAYANIYVIDLATDAWAPGTPVRVRLEDEGTDMAAARQAARDEAAGLIADLDIDVPADVWALVGDGEDADGTTLAFGQPGYLPGERRGGWTLTLDSFEAPASDPCESWFGQAPLGFALELAGEGDTRELHRDTRIPKSRGCPLDYRLHGVVAPYQASGVEAGVALVSVYPGGFEGPDRRFVAVPLRP